MMFSKKRIVFFSIAAFLFVVIVKFRQLSGVYSTVFSNHPTKSTPLPGNKYDSETQPTYNPVVLPGDQTGNETQHNSIEAMYQRLVVLTAFSSNHFREALDMIGSVQKYLPRAKIIVYDIGLTTNEKSNVLKFCNVELRSFKFSKYPSHVTNLTKYAFKPLILQELVDQGYDMILYGDASLRLMAHNITTALRCLLDFPFLDVKAIHYSTISFTHNKMIKYFQFPPTRQYMARWGTIQSGGWFLLVNNLTREKLIAPWVDCALHKECIAPKGAKKKPCNFALDSHNHGTYVGCHRYDQSALNIILAKNFGLEVWDKVVRKNVTSQLATAVRHSQGIYPVKYHPHCSHAEN